MPVTTIYTLSDPITGVVRYVGKTRDPKARIRNHLGKRENNYKGNWIESLRRQGLAPDVAFIDEVPTEEWSFWEQHWIQTFLGWGFPLTNANAGGGKYARFTPELKVKHKASFTEAVRNVMREKAVATNADPEFKAHQKIKIAEAMSSPAVKAKVQKANDPANATRSTTVRAQWADPAFKEERRRRMLAANANPEVKAKRSANAKQQYGDGGFAAVQAKAHAARSKGCVLTNGDRVVTTATRDEAATVAGCHPSVISRIALGQRKSNVINGWKISEQ